MVLNLDFQEVLQHRKEDTFKKSKLNIKQKTSPNVILFLQINDKDTVLTPNVHNPNLQ